MSTCVDPQDFQGEWRIEQKDGFNPRLIVHQADKRVSLSRELWAHLVDVAYHEALLVDGGPCIHETDDELFMDIGKAGEGLGRVTYRVAGVTPQWILVERVDEQA